MTNNKMTMGLIVGNRGFFPDHLAKSGREEMIRVLEAAGIATARGVLVLTGNDLLNITTAVTIRTLNPEVRIVLRMLNQHLIGRLGKTLHNVFALSTSLLTAPILALTAVTGQALATFAIDNDAETRRQIIDIPITATSQLCGRLIADVIGPRDAVVVAHRTGESCSVAILDETVRPYCTIEPFAEPVRRLRCFRGISDLGALTIAAELGDARRFPTA